MNEPPRKLSAFECPDHNPLRTHHKFMVVPGWVPTWQHISLKDSLGFFIDFVLSLLMIGANVWFDGATSGHKAASTHELLAQFAVEVKTDPVVINE